MDSEVDFRRDAELVVGVSDSLAEGTGATVGGGRDGVGGWNTAGFERFKARASAER